MPTRLSFDFSSLGSAAAKKNSSRIFLQYLNADTPTPDRPPICVFGNGPDFQCEVGRPDNGKTRQQGAGFLTVLVEAAFKAEKLFDVPGRAFKPAPAVTSSVIRLVPIDTGEYDAKIFRNVISRGFAQKRKTRRTISGPFIPMRSN